MSSPNQLKPPSDPKAYLFAYLYGLYDRTVPDLFRTPLFEFFSRISPAVPVSLRHGMRDPDKRAAVIQSFLITIFFCFVANAALTSWYGTFIGNDPERLYFFEDYYNIVLYTIICPLYVSGAVYIFLVTIEGWSHLREFADAIGEERVKIRKFRPTLIIFIIISISSLFIVNYTIDILNAPGIERVYWFMELSATGEHILNPVGAYYVVMNFVLLLVTLVAISCFFSLFFEVIKIGSLLGRSDEDVHVAFDEFKNALSSFIQVYLAAKIMVVLYIVNFYIWRASPLGETTNLFATLIALTIIGLFFVSFLRYFVELQWHYYKQRAANAPALGSDNVRELPHDDIRPLGMRVTAHILDMLIIGGFLVSAWVEYIGIRL